MRDSFETTIYQSLQDFELDDPSHEFGFTRHLMKNHGWTLTYTQRAIAEYKKFVFLTVVANHQVVPSDQVDQVWHAHVLLTKSYWEEFCPKVLGKKLHHHPAQGGKTERAEFHHLYIQTIASYRHFFGSPPIDIWSPPDLRFGTELKMQRVNLNEHWVIPKRLPQFNFPKPLLAVAIISLMLVCCADTAQGSTLERFVTNLTTNQVTSIIFGVSVVLGLILRYVIQMPNQQPQKPQLDIYQVAYLAGGSLRAVELGITQLVHQGYLRPNVRNRTFAIAKTLSPEASDLEQQVMQQVNKTPDFKSLRQMKYNTHFLRQQLKQEKLVMADFENFVSKSFALFFITPFLGLIMLSVVQSFLGIKIVLSEIGLLAWVITLIVSICCYVPSERTHWGSRILADIKKNHDVYDVTQRFALYGYQVLSGGALDDLKQIFKAEAEEESASGCGC
jgi:uncharacterized protein (TIGR04222 family)